MSDTVEKLLKKGVEFHQLGQAEFASQIYKAILAVQPQHPDANYNMGLLAIGSGQIQAGLIFLEKALEANADNAMYWISYINVLIEIGRVEDAQAVFDQAKLNGAKGEGFDRLEQKLKNGREEPLEVNSTGLEEKQPRRLNILDSLNLDQAINLAKNKAKEGAPEEAKFIYQDILTKFSKNKRAINGLKGLADTPVGNASKVQDPPLDQRQALIDLYSQGQLDLVVEHAAVLTKKYPKSLTIWNLMGVSAAQTGQLDQAIFAFKRMLAIKPDDAEAYYNMGKTLKAQGKLEEAIEAYNKALAIKPAYADAYYNMGNALKEQGKLEEAIEAYNKALAIKPDYVEAYTNMGIILQEQGKLEEAIEAYNKALALKPDYADAYYNMSFAKLLTSSWREGIELRKWRRHTQEYQQYFRDFSAREWDGKESSHNKTLLVWAEGGPGDVVIWSSCISHYANIFRKIIIECHPKLVDLLERSLPNVHVRSSEDRSAHLSADFDFQVPMETLFGYACLEGACTELQSSYLFPDPQRVNYWSGKLRKISSRKTVGLSWKSPFMTAQRANNYPSLSYWGKTLKKYRSEFTFVNLQSTDYRDDIAYLKDHFGCEIVHFDQLDLYNDLSDVAALSQALDCSISVATAAATISAAVGTKTIIPTWKHGPWNNILFNSRGPAVDILLKNTSDSWAPVFEEVETKLKVLNAEY
jgi:tetratricopeptide (TPR) repeat protein